MTSLINTSAQELDASIRCSVANRRPYPLDLLRSERAREAAGVGPRTTVLKILDREIRRQEKAARREAA